MERVLIVLALVLVSVFSRSKGQKGRRGAQKSRAPRRPRIDLNLEEEPLVQMESLQRSVAPAAQRELPKESTAPSMQSAPDEGTSRQCEHGAVGGSIKEHAHEGAPKAKRATDEPEQQAAYRPRPRLDARELRRAVVMAEILKRPCERGRR